MPQILISNGTSDESETAYLNALAGVIGAMNDAAESRITSRQEISTPNGIVVTLEVVIYSEDELAMAEPDIESEDTGGGTGAVSHGYRRPTQIGDYLYMQSSREIERGMQEMQDHALDDMAHPEFAEIHPPADMEAQFEEAAHPSDASYVHIYDEAADSADHEADWGARITTELVQQEIEDSVRHDVLSAGTVTWQEQQEIKESLQKEVKKRRPSVDDLDLVA